MSIETTFGRAEKSVTFVYGVRRELAGVLRAMAQRIENNGWPRFMMAVAVIVAAQMILAAAGAGFGAYVAIGKVNTTICYTNQRIDLMQHPQLQPRNCD